jgi:hypothetical protein
MFSVDYEIISPDLYEYIISIEKVKEFTGCWIARVESTITQNEI